MISLLSSLLLGCLYSVSSYKNASINLLAFAPIKLRVRMEAKTSNKIQEYLQDSSRLSSIDSNGTISTMSSIASIFQSCYLPFLSFSIFPQLQSIVILFPLFWPSFFYCLGLLFHFSWLFFLEKIKRI